MTRSVKRKRDLLRLVPDDQLGRVTKLALFSSVVPLLMRLPLAHSERLLSASASLFNGSRDRSRIDIESYLHCMNLAVKLGRPITQDRCLTRCVTLYVFLTRAGMDLTIVFGAGTPEGVFAAHCWLECDGTPFAEPEDPYSVYSPTYTIPFSSGAIGRPKR